MFEVNLIRVPVPLLAEHRDELARNHCRHVHGSWWIFEGDEWALRTPVEVHAVGYTSGLHRDDVPDGLAIIQHAIEIFGLTQWPPPDRRRWFDGSEAPDLDQGSVP